MMCRDCGERPALIQLPEGRYLCAECWESLRALRVMVIRETARLALVRSIERRRKPLEDIGVEFAPVDLEPAP